MNSPNSVYAMVFSRVFPSSQDLEKLTSGSKFAPRPRSFPRSGLLLVMLGVVPKTKYTTLGPKLYIFSVLSPRICFCFVNP